MGSQEYVCGEQNPDWYTANYLGSGCALIFEVLSVKYIPMKKYMSHTQLNQMHYDWGPLINAVGHLEIR